jgi:hypothetical protein
MFRLNGTSNRMHHCKMRRGRVMVMVLRQRSPRSKLRGGTQSGGHLHEDCTCDDFRCHTLVGRRGVLSLYRCTVRSIPVLCRILVALAWISWVVTICASVALSIAQTETVVCDVVLQLLARACFPESSFAFERKPMVPSEQRSAQLLESPCPGRAYQLCGPHLDRRLFYALEGEICPICKFISKERIYHL